MPLKLNGSTSGYVIVDAPAVAGTNTLTLPAGTGVVTAYDTATTSTGYLDLPAGTTAQRPASPTSGNIRFNTSLNYLEYYDGTSWNSVNNAYSVDYLVVAGGGGSGSAAGSGNGTGGGGAGGYLSVAAASIIPGASIINTNINDVKTAKPVLNVIYLKTFKKPKISTNSSKKL